ncbi:MAG: hypothetical protein K6F31_00970, partial [Acetatifactor sp.]|nr:hypothetical protein [Acetatifactor sp.]
SPTRSPSRIRGSLPLVQEIVFASASYFISGPDFLDALERSAPVSELKVILAPGISLPARPVSSF